MTEYSIAEYYNYAKLGIHAPNHLNKWIYSHDNRLFYLFINYGNVNVARIACYLGTSNNARMSFCGWGRLIHLIHARIPSTKLNLYNSHRTSYLNVFTRRQWLVGSEHPEVDNYVYLTQCLTLKALKYFCINHGDTRVFSIWSHHKCLSFIWIPILW